MPDIVLFLICVAAGFVLATPLGPVNLVCIDRALARGGWAGVITGLGAVGGDLIYATVAAYGIGVVLSFVSTYEGIIELVGGLLLIVFGVGAIRSNPHVERANGGPSGLHLAVLATFTLTITNPAALFGLLAFFGSITRFVGPISGFWSTALAVAGICTGSLLWWATLSYLVSHMRTRITDRWLKRIAIGSGVVLIAFGTVVAIKGGLMIAGVSLA